MKDRKFRQKLQTEIDTSFLYRTIASMEKDEQIRSFFTEMAKIEAVHARKLLEKEKETILTELPGPSLRARILRRLGKIAGPGLLLAIAMETEKSITSAVLKKKSEEGKAIEGNEDRHVNILKSISQLSGEKLRKVEGSHLGVGGNALRAAVLGANDGLVSNMSLVMGVAGATHGGTAVLIAGIAGLLAGAFSMALGEWISVKSSQELYERQIEIEAEEIENNPEEERQEVILLYKAKGLTEIEATAMADQVFADKNSMQALLVKEELGLNPDEMKGSAWEAAIASFILFVTGAIVPVFPFFFTSGDRAIVISLVASILALFLIGASITLITGKPFLRSGFRQVLFGLAAAAITYGIGRLIGVSLGT
jgi:VIT1/CCC1 family predicted Fe2+/Mn2+ transporter